MYNKGHGEVKIDILLLLIANNCWTRLFALGYWLFIFLVFLTQMRKENLCSYLPLPLLGTVNFWQSVNILCWTICWIKHRRHMILVLVMSLLLRVYYLLRSTHNAIWWVIMNSFDSTISYFWLYLLFIARSARFVLLGGLCTFSVLHGLYCLSETWVVRVLKVTVIPAYPVL